MRLRRNVSLLRDAAPDDVASVDRLDVWLVLLSYGRTIPIRADQDIGVFDPAVSKACGDARCSLHYRDEVVVEMEAEFEEVTDDQIESTEEITGIPAFS